MNPSTPRFQMAGANDFIGNLGRSEAGAAPTLPTPGPALQGEPLSSRILV
jgi:hypothetical protein